MLHNRIITRPARTLTLITLFLSVTACSTSHRSIYYVNTGVSGSLPIKSGCSHPRATPEGSFTVDKTLRYYKNTGPGKLSLRCKGSTLEMVARPFVTMKITGPATVTKDQTLYLSLEVYDRNGVELLTGSSPEVTWSLGAPLRNAGRSDSVFASFNHASVRVIADKAGTGSVTATYQGRTITRSITIR